ncbi:uncharacterized protein KZ484_021186 [Pholidichthys leucotaenia]
MWKRFSCTGRLCCFPKDPLDDIETWSESVDKVLSSKAGQIAFREFLKTEYSEENLLFWLACEDYKKIKTVPEMISSANRIYSEFVQTEAPRQINIDFGTRESIAKNISQPTLNSFDTAQKLVYSLMARDCYPRFLKSSIYQGLLRRNDSRPSIHVLITVVMPSLTTSPPRELQHLNMETGKAEKRRRGNLKGQLQCKSSQVTNTDGLCFEEMSQWSQSLDRLLSSKYGMKIFQAFLKSEFSDENIEFWIVCEDYKKIRSSFRMSSRAKKIFKRYIQAEAPREINIDHRTREVIRQNMEAPSAVCFNDAQKIVYGLMERDSYPRFLKSDIYRTLLDSTSESVKM